MTTLTNYPVRKDPALVRAALAYAADHTAAATARRFGVADTTVARWISLAAELGPDWPGPDADEWWAKTERYRARKAAAMRNLRKRRYFGAGPQVVAATGTRRRIQALMRLGWSTPAIAVHGGWGTAEAVQDFLRRDRVLVATRDRVARVYDDLSMRLGGSLSTQRYAERNGWPPPLAWDDDIDDPAATPAGTTATTEDDDIDDQVDQSVVQRILDGDRVPATTAERFEVRRRWKALGRPLAQLEREQGWKADRYKADHEAVA